MIRIVDSWWLTDLNHQFPPGTSLTRQDIKIARTVYLENSSIVNHSFGQVEKFCDDQTHRSDVKNMHNTKCNSNSVWSIIEKHRDFASGAYVLFICFFFHF